MERDLQSLVRGRRHPTDLALDTVAELLKLTTYEKEYVRLCVAAAYEGFGTHVFSLFSQPSRASQALRHILEAPDEHTVRAMLRPGSALLRSGLLDMGFRVHSPGDLEELLRISAHGLLVLASGARTAAKLAAVILRELATREEPGLRWPHLNAHTGVLRQLLMTCLSKRQRGINVLLYGEPGTGKTQFAAQLVRQCGAKGYAVAETNPDGDSASRNERLSSLMLTQLFAGAGQSVVVLDEAEDIFQHDYNNPVSRIFSKSEGGKAWINGLLENNTNPVIWISNRIDHLDPSYLRRFTYCLEFPRTPRGVRRDIAKAHLAAVGCSESVIDAAARDPHISPGLLASAARFVSMAELPPPEVGNAVQNMLGSMIKALGHRPRSGVPPRATQFHTRFLNAKGPVTPDAIIAGMARLGRGRLLLNGPPGTGKTQLAAEIATRLGRELVYRTASDINSMWFGESERNVARMFEDCDPAGEVLLLDEADTLLAARDGAGHRADMAVTAEFLRQVEAFQGVFVGATNFGRSIDGALLRRFEFRLELQALTTVQRLDLFANVALDWDPTGTDSRPLLDAKVEAELARLDLLTPGDFANVVRRIHALDLHLEPSGWVEELRMEHETKPGAQRTTIGFTS